MKKYVLIITALALAATHVAAASLATFKGTTCTLNVEYNASAQQGDALIVRMTLRSLDKKRALKDTAAVAELHNETKRIETAQFFAANQKTKRQSVQEMLAYVPLSTWLSEGDYTLKVIYTAFGSEPEKFTLPVSVLAKDFIKETIPLNERNTAIRTDTSSERIAQIDRLNNVLATVNAANIYTIKPFMPPVAPDTRRTSFFGDRRIYAYSSGRTATSEHYGIDYGVPEGTVVSSCADGRVVLAENRISTGWSVVIEHAPGLYSLYYHMSVLNVKEGQIVKQGDRIGLSGATGLATGPHLHWEVRLNKCAVSPDFFTGDYAYTKPEN